MTTDTNLQFIREKIYETRSAIMYNMSDALVKLPNNIIKALNVDEEGNLWFLSEKPAQEVTECEKDFPARLKFYKKGITYFIEVSGKATILKQQKINQTDTSAKDTVLVKMTMTNIEYSEAEEKKDAANFFLDKAYKWLFGNKHPHTLSIHH